MTLIKNSIHTVKIEDITNLGFGVARIFGNVVFVSGAVTGDVIECKIIKVGRGYSVGKAERIIERSGLFTEARCTVSACRSCAYKNIEYAEEIRIKTEHVRQEMKKAGLHSINVMQATPSPCQSEYRNKAQYPIANGKDGVVIGFYAPKSHRVTEAACCPISPKIFSSIIELLRNFLNKYKISAYDEELGRGLMRHVYLRRSECEGEIVLTLVINGDGIPHAEELVSTLTESYPEIVGILINKNKASTNVILSDEYETLFGRNYIYDTLGGVRLKISAPAFYQVNHAVAELIYKKAKELADLKRSDTLLDLYCGAGSIGLSMADEAGEVIGIEIVESAVECAKENAKENGITNAEFYAGDAKNTEKMLDRATALRGRPINPDVVILDPPRAGSSEELLRFISKLGPRKIVYVSCSPQTLARDIRILEDLGFTADTVYPMDMFPMTGHVESVVCLTRRLDNELRERMN